MFDLTGKVAIVTGGNGGIGLGIAKGLAGAGASVVVAGRDAKKSADAVAALGPKAIALPVDVADKASIEALVAETVKRFGRLDILVANAGVTVRKPPQDLTDEEWDHVLNVNLTGVFQSCRAAYPHMKAAGGGKIITIGSMMSIFGAPFGAAYGATKGGVVQMTRAMATAWAPDNIQVNAILPGWIDTAMTQGARSYVPTLHQSVLERTPAGRWGAPEDFSGIAVFLAAPASDFVTGTAIPVDGGYSIRG